MPLLTSWRIFAWQVGIGAERVHSLVMLLFFYLFFLCFSLLSVTMINTVTKSSSECGGVYLFDLQVNAGTLNSGRTLLTGISIQSSLTPTLHQLASHKINSSQTWPGHSGVEVLSQLTSVCVRLTPEANRVILSSLHKCSVTVKAVQQGGGFPSGPACLLCVLQPKCVASSAIGCFKDLFLFTCMNELLHVCLYTVHMPVIWRGCHSLELSYRYLWATWLWVLVITLGSSAKSRKMTLTHWVISPGLCLHCWKLFCITIEFLDYNFLFIFCFFNLVLSVCLINLRPPLCQCWGNVSCVTPMPLHELFFSYCFQHILLLWVWVLTVLLYCCWRYTSFSMCDFFLLFWICRLTFPFLFPSIGCHFMFVDMLFSQISEGTADFSCLPFRLIVLSWNLKIDLAS